TVVLKELLFYEFQKLYSSVSLIGKTGDISAYSTDIKAWPSPTSSSSSAHIVLDS
ncbi:hypothetical protein STEG23_012286, partial [Scotinomys teguina]